jgi:hypothetical protein
MVRLCFWSHMVLANHNLSARPCSANGICLPRHTPPAPRDSTHDWTPFEDLESFEFANYEFVKRGSSAEDINTALHTWASRSTKLSGMDTSPFKDHDDMMKTIDSISYGECSWSSFEAQHGGPVNNSSPPYMLASWTVHCRDTLEVVRSMMDNRELDGHFNYVARQDFVPVTGEPNKWQREFSDVMSGDWAWQESVSASDQLVSCIVSDW